MSLSTITQTEPSSSSPLEMQPIAKWGENENIFGQLTENQKKPNASDPEDIRDEAIPPETAIEAKQKWNSPRINMWRVLSCYFSFLIVGMNDGSYGVSSNWKVLVYSC
jgi:hypothetical protein